MKKNEIPLCVAAVDGDLDRVVELLGHGLDPNQRTDATPAEPAGRTALHYAAMFNETEIVAALIDAGAHVNARDADGDSPIFCCSNIATTRLLLDSGAVIGFTGKFGHSVLHRYCSPETLQLLIDAGANLEARDKKGRTPIFQMMADLDRLNFVLDRGVDFRARDNDGSSVLYQKSGYLVSDDCVRRLVELGFDINEPNPIDGSTALHFHLDISEYDHMSDSAFYDPWFLKCLLDCGANPLIRNHEELNAFDLADRLYRDPDPDDPDWDADYWNEARDVVLQCLKEASLQS
ncbi:MAG: ankyrin repeat domain-containing protein [Verrucomicrobiota bacterium]